MLLRKLRSSLEIKRIVINAPYVFLTIFLKQKIYCPYDCVGWICLNVPETCHYAWESSAIVIMNNLVNRKNHKPTLVFWTSLIFTTRSIFSFIFILSMKMLNKYLVLEVNDVMFQQPLMDCNSYRDKVVLWEL